MVTQEKVQDFLTRASKAMLGVDMDAVRMAITVLEGVRERSGFVWLIGNGGSAATASHFANDLEKMCGIRAIAISDLVPTMTAYGNDDGWHKMFAHALKGYASPGDVLVVFSCSGYSGNVIEAAKDWEKDDPVIIFTGNDRLSKLANAVTLAGNDIGLFVDDPDIMVQESVHSALCHAIVDVLKKEQS